MVSNEENQKEEEQEEVMPELQPEDMFKCLWLAIHASGGIMTIPRRVLEGMPEDAKIDPEYNKEYDAFILSTTPKAKRKRGKIITKKKGKIYLPPKLKIFGSG